MKIINVISALAIIISLISVNISYKTVQNYNNIEQQETACTSVVKMNRYTVTVPTFFNDLSSILVRVDSKVVDKHTEMNIRRLIHEIASRYSGGQTKDFADELYARLSIQYVDDEKDIRLYDEHKKRG